MAIYLAGRLAHVSFPVKVALQRALETNSVLSVPTLVDSNTGKTTEDTEFTERGMARARASLAP
jgi:hypothetical protein